MEWLPPELGGITRVNPLLLLQRRVRRVFSGCAWTAVAARPPVIVCNDCDPTRDVLMRRALPCGTIGCGCCSEWPPSHRSFRLRQGSAACCALSRCTGQCLLCGTRD